MQRASQASAVDVSADEPATLAALFADRGDRKTLLRRDRLHRAGAPLFYAYLVVDGWIGRFRTGPAADAFTGIYVAGDVIGVDALTSGEMADELTALSDAAVLRLPLSEVRAAVARGGRAATEIADLLAMDSRFLREALVAIGTQSSQERLSTFLLQTYRRLLAAGLIEPDADRFELPLTQVQLGAVTGITSVHINRVLRALRAAGQFDVGGGSVRIANVAGLRHALVLAG